MRARRCRCAGRRTGDNLARRGLARWRRKNLSRSGRHGQGSRRNSWRANWRRRRWSVWSMRGHGRTNRRRRPGRRFDNRRLRRRFRLAGQLLNLRCNRGLFHHRLWRLLDSDRGSVAIALFVASRMPFPVADGLQAKTHSQFVGDVLIDRAGVCQLFRHSHFRQKLQNQMGLHLQLTRKHVDTDLLHIRTKCKRGDS
jgi:hypothetical protein